RGRQADDRKERIAEKPWVRQARDLSQRRSDHRAERSVRPQAVARGLWVLAGGVVRRPVQPSAGQALFRGDLTVRTRQDDSSTPARRELHSQTGACGPDEIGHFVGGVPAAVSRDPGSNGVLNDYHHGWIARRNHDGHRLGGADLRPEREDQAIGQARHGQFACRLALVVDEYLPTLNVCLPVPGTRSGSLRDMQSDGLAVVGDDDHIQPRYHILGRGGTLRYDLYTALHRLGVDHPAPPVSHGLPAYRSHRDPGQALRCRRFQLKSVPTPPSSIGSSWVGDFMAAHDRLAAPFPGTSLWA